MQGDPGREPLRLPGWQAQYQAGVTAAVAVLAGLRMPGVRHIDVSWTACLITGCELHVADGVVAGRRWPPTGPFPITAFPGGALPCADGFVVPGSFRDVDWEAQCLLYDLPELIVDERYRTRAARAERVDEVWDLIREWYAAHTKDEIFDLALDTPWTVGKVLSAAEALVDAHLGRTRVLRSAGHARRTRSSLRCGRSAPRACRSPTSGCAPPPSPTTIPLLVEPTQRCAAVRWTACACSR